MLTPKEIKTETVEVLRASKKPSRFTEIKNALSAIKAGVYMF